MTGLVLTTVSPELLCAKATPLKVANSRSEAILTVCDIFFSSAQGCPRIRQFPLWSAASGMGRSFLSHANHWTTRGRRLAIRIAPHLSQACIARSRQSRDLTRREDLWPTRDVGAAGIVGAQLKDRTWPIRVHPTWRRGWPRSGHCAAMRHTARAIFTLWKIFATQHCRISPS